MITKYFRLDITLGLIAFALFPLCVAAILKAPPFAVLALRFPAHVYSDKLGWLHRWTGRFIFGLTIAHVALWSVQLGRDRRVGINGGGIAWIYAFEYDKFIFGIIVSVKPEPPAKRHPFI